MDSLAGISYYLNKCSMLLLHHFKQFCLSARQSTRQCILHPTQSNCCSAKLNSPELCPYNSPELNFTDYEIYSHIAAWSWVASNKTEQIKPVTGWSLEMQKYSIWVKGLKGCYFCLSNSPEALVRWGGKVKYLLIAYFLSNICAKNYQNRFICVRVIATQSSNIVWDTV